MQAVFMHKERAVKHWIDRLGLTRVEANEKWAEERAKATFVRHDGPKGQEDRIPVKEDDFLQVEDAIVSERSAVNEFKRAKWSEDIQDQMQEALQGRSAGAESNLRKFGLDSFDRPEMVAEFLGGSSAAASSRQGEAEAGVGAAAEPTPEEASRRTGKVFDAATERIACQNKLLQSLDKIFEELKQTHADASKLMAMVNEAGDTPANEIEAQRLIADRARVALKWMGSYAPGNISYTSAAVDHDQAAFLQELESTSAELPDFFTLAPCCLAAVSQLVEEVRKVSSFEDKKTLEGEFKPVLNVMTVMKTSLKGAADKLRKFMKDRAAREDKARRQDEQAAAKQLAADKKKREAEERKLSKAAEKLGKVGSIWDVDFVKLSVRPLEICSVPDAAALTKVDWSRPWVMKTDSGHWPTLQALLQDAKVRTAAMQGSMRFTQPVQGTLDCCKAFLQELGIAETLPTGCLSCPPRSNKNYRFFCAIIVTQNNGP